MSLKLAALVKGKNLSQSEIYALARANSECFCEDASLTQQHQADQVDVKKILERYEKSGVLPINKNPALYGDFSDVPSFQQAMDIVIQAQNQFDGLDASIRQKFDNDPEKLLSFVNDPQNFDEGVKIGIFNPKPQSAPIEPPKAPV